MLTSALTAINNPTTANNIRQQAQGVCDAFYQHVDTINLALTLYDANFRKTLEPNIDPKLVGDYDFIRFFALSALERSFKHRWSEFFPRDKTHKENSSSSSSSKKKKKKKKKKKNKDANLTLQALQKTQQACLDLLRSGTRGTNEAPFIKEKIVCVVSAAAEQCWPEHWDVFMPEIKKIALIGIPQAELCLGVFRNLAEDSVDSDFNSALSARRRNLILKGLNNNVEDVLKLIMTLLESTIYSNKQQPTNELITLAKVTNHPSLD